MFAAAVLPALALSVGMLMMSHSPRWLAMQGRWDDADAVLERIDPRHKQQEIQLLHRNVEESAGTSWRTIFAALAIVFIRRFVPETKGRPLEHIDRYWTEGRWPESRAA